MTDKKTKVVKIMEALTTTHHLSAVKIAKSDLVTHKKTISTTGHLGTLDSGKNQSDTSQGNTDTPQGKDGGADSETDSSGKDGS